MIAYSCEIDEWTGLHIDLPSINLILITESKDPTYRGPMQGAADAHVHSSDVGSSSSGLKITFLPWHYDVTINLEL